MISSLNFQTGYALARCALAYGKSYIPYSHLNHKVTEFFQRLLLTCDALSMAYAGWQIHKTLPEHKKREGIRFYIDLAVNTALLAGVSALFVMAMNRLVVPTTSLTDLLKSTKIPQKTLEVIADESMDHVKAVWTKPLMENLTTGLLFMRTLMDLGLAHLTGKPLHRLHAAIYALTTLKTAQYQTLAIHHSFDDLFHQFSYSAMYSQKYAEFTDYFAVPIKKVEAIFYLNVEGLSESALSDKIQAIYDYSSKMFHKSFWDREWKAPRISYFSSPAEYYDRVIRNPNQAMDAYNNLFRRFNLKYTATLAGDPPPVPVALRLFHEHTLWQPFLGIDITEWIPRFMVPAQEIPYAAWIDAELITPITSLDKNVSSIYRILGKLEETLKNLG